jgi:hypothetical protein
MTLKTWHLPMIGLLMITLIAGRAWGQTERVLHFAHTEGHQNMSGISGMIRTISEIPAALSDAEKTLTLQGTPEQIALAEWLFVQLDTPPAPASNQPNSTVREYLLKGAGENTVRVFFLANTATVQDFQEAAAAIRAITEIRREFASYASRAIAARGTPDQIALAAWMVDVLDRAAGEKAASREHRMPESSDPHGEVVTRAFYVSNATTIQDFQEIAGSVRAMAEIRRTFTVNAYRVIFARSTPEALDLADWLIQQVDKPAIGKPGAPAVQSSDAYGYTTTFDADTTVKVLYLPQIATVQDFQAFAARIRSTTNMRRTFAYSAPRAIAVRGTVDQIEMAERMAQGLDSPK